MFIISMGFLLFGSQLIADVVSSLSLLFAPIALPVLLSVLGVIG